MAVNIVINHEHHYVINMCCQQEMNYTFRIPTLSNKENECEHTMK